MFKIISESSPVKLKMSHIELDLAIHVVSYINDNFHASDFFTIGHANNEEVANLLTKLKQDHVDQTTEIFLLRLSKKQYTVFKDVFFCYNYCLADIEEFVPEHDQIREIAKVLSPPSRIYIELDQETLGVVIKVFTYMLENLDELDYSKMDLQPPEELESLLKTIKTYKKDCGTPAFILMNFNEWITYAPYIDHANDCFLSDEEMDVMDKLGVQYRRMRAKKITPVAMEVEFNSYLVGGSVRDELLGLPVSDKDWVVRKVIPKQLTGHKGLVCDYAANITLEEDLLRRVLTINAIAKTPEGDYIDPYGGIADIEAKIIRHVPNAFAENPLRVLRVARFAARYATLGFNVHESTMQLMTELVSSGELDNLTPKRVWKEMSRALDAPKPSIFFMMLKQCGALGVVLPEVDCLFGVPQPATYHPEIDTGIHVMMVVDIAREMFNTPQVTWGALMHDLGKGVTPKFEWPQHIKHEINGVPLVKSVCQRFKVPKDYMQLAMLASEHHLRCHKLLEMKPNKIMRLLEELDAFRRPERLIYFAQICEADAKGRLGLENREYPQSKYLEKYFEAARNVDIKPLLEKGYEDLELANQIRQLRIAAIKECKTNSPFS